MKLGKLIRTKRTKLGWSLEKLGSYIDIKRAYMWEIETKGKLPSHTKVVKLAEALGCPELIKTYISEKYPEVKKLTKSYEHMMGEKQMMEDDVVNQMISDKNL